MIKKIITGAVVASIAVTSFPTLPASAEPVNPQTLSTTQSVSAVAYQTRIITGVPDLLWGRGCSLSSTEMVLRYWNQYKGKTNLIPAGYGFMQFQNYLADNYYFPDSQGAVYSARVRTYLDNYLASRGYRTASNSYYFGTQVAIDAAWTKLKNEVDANRPLLLSMYRYNDGQSSFEGGHMVAVVGYSETAAGRQIIVHNTAGRGDIYYPWRTSDFEFLYSVNIS